MLQFVEKSNYIMKKDLELPFNFEKARSILDEFGSPIYVYDEAGIRDTAKRLNNAFSWAKGYKNYFAVKATPTPGIIKLLIEEGMGVDCSTKTELLMAKQLGLTGKDIFYSSNNTPMEDFELAVELDSTVNIDDLAHVPVFAAVLGDKKLTRVAARYNPGDLKSGNAIIGEPTEAKYGMDTDSLIKSFDLLKDLSVEEFGLHTMVASNELGAGYFADTADILLKAVVQIEEATGVRLTFINLGGGFGLNYHVDEGPFDVEDTSMQIKNVLKKHDRQIQVFTENGRYVTGASGYLLTSVRYVMNKYKTYLGVDASMHNLMRPGMYGAYHHITVLGKDKLKHDHQYDVVGSLCENNDKFAVNRRLPKVEPGDLLVIHDVGAHGHAMGFNYNGLLRSAEVLLTSSGQVKLLRKAESPEDYFQNIVWN